MRTGLAATDGAKAKPAAREKLPTNLRGSETPDVPPAAKSPAAIVPTTQGAASSKPSPLAALPLPASPFLAPKPDEAACRTSCDHAYYFCLSGSVNADCSGSWGQCLSACSYPNPTLDR